MVICNTLFLYLVKLFLQPYLYHQQIQQNEQPSNMEGHFLLKAENLVIMI